MLQRDFGLLAGGDRGFDRLVGGGVDQIAQIGAGESRGPAHEFAQIETLYGIGYRFESIKDGVEATPADTSA